MENINEIKKIISKLCIDDLSKITTFILGILDKKSKSTNSTHEIIDRENKIYYCKECGSTHIVKNGKTPSNSQKYLCKDCNKSFSTTTNTVVYHSKKNYKVWIKFIEAELLGLTLRKTASYCNISVTTAFSWRMKFNESISEYVNSVKLGGEIQMDPTYMLINLKGTKPINMPRPSKKRKTPATNGFSDEHVCIMCALDENDHLFMNITGLGREDYFTYQSVKCRVDKPKKIISDNAWGYKSLAKELNCELAQVPSKHHVTKSGDHIQDLNSIHSQYKNYLKRYRGVSTRHLQGYTDFFVFLKELSNRFNLESSIDSAYIKMISANKKLYVKNICTKPMPVDLLIPYGSHIRKKRQYLY